LDIVDECVNDETCTLLEYWDFLAKSVDKAWCLLERIAWDLFKFEKASRVFSIHFLILAYSMLDLIMLLFGVRCVNLLTMKLIRVLIMYAMFNLTLYHPRTMLMLSCPYIIHHFLLLSARGSGRVFFWV